jgi:drug/metabolite transporter (DMT)-like permease
MKGLGYALFSAATYGLMSFLVHWNPSDHPVEQLIFLRGMISILLLLPFCYRELGKYFGPSCLSLWVRALAGSGGVICYFYTLQGTTSANANVLFSSSPIYVVALSWIFFREKLGRLELFGISCIVLGNVLLYLPNRSSIPLWVWVVGSGGAVFASIAYLSLGAATKKYSSSLIVFGFALTSTLVAFAIPTSPWLPLAKSDAAFLITVSLLGLLSQVSATLSFAHLKSSVATSIGRSSILFSGLLDIFVGHYRPHLFEWASYLVVILGIYLAHQRPKMPV